MKSVYVALFSCMKNITVMKKKNNNKSINFETFITAVKKGSRESEKELFGPGFHSFYKVHKSKKLYTRKNKHKGKQDF